MMPKIKAISWVSSSAVIGTALVMANLPALAQEINAPEAEILEYSDSLDNNEANLEDDSMRSVSMGYYPQN